MRMTKHHGPTLPSLGSLLPESVAEGFQFLSRLVAEWESGENRFERPGEGLFFAFEDNEIAGIGGLNRDPYASLGWIARLRHLYVSPKHRRRGIGRALVWQIVSSAKGRFQTLRLRTDTRDADRFYVSLGFERLVNVADATHDLQL